MVGPLSRVAPRGAWAPAGVTSEHKGPQTPPPPQQLVTAQPKPGGQSALRLHARKPAQGVLPGMQAPPPSGVVKQRQSGLVAAQRGRLPQAPPAQVGQA